MEQQPNLTDHAQGPVDPSTNNMLNGHFLSAMLHHANSAFLLFQNNNGLTWWNERARLLLPTLNAPLTFSQWIALWEASGFSNGERLADDFELARRGQISAYTVDRITEKETQKFHLRIFPFEGMKLHYVLQLDQIDDVDALQKEREARQKAEQNDRLKTVFLANMSHEIRTPLNSILGFSELLLEFDSLESDAREYLEMIGIAGNTLLQLINDIIDISKIEAGQLKISKLPVDVNTVLNELLQTMLNSKAYQQHPHVQMVIEQPEADFPLILETDPFRFKQIFTNLLTNALKFVDGGTIRFGFTEIKQDWVQFFVQDTGIGMRYDQTEHIFQRFSRLDTPHGYNADGTGLGLSISKQLVELLGGKIWFDSVVGKGTTFYFTLPLGAKENNPLKSKRIALLDTTPDWSDEMFLVVDDVEANFMFYRSMMKHTGAVLLWAKDGDEAIRLCRNNSAISLILMDLMMPNLDGFETTRQIRTFRPQLPIIAQTAFYEAEGREIALKAGCDDYITKPIQQSDLVLLINQLLKKR